MDEHGIDVSLLMADYQDTHLASMFLVISNKRGFYLFGASTRDKKNRMASYALQWDAGIIHICRKNTCRSWHAR